MSARIVPDRLITTYLEMTSPDELRADYTDSPEVEIRPVRFTDVAAYRELYSGVGAIWNWRDRLIMPDDELRAALATADVNVLYVAGQPAGYVELVSNPDGSVEVAYFGLFPAFFGRGLGKHLLSYGLQRAWDSGANRVWVHTCNLDGPAALANYTARGFKISHVEDIPMPDRYK